MHVSIRLHLVHAVVAAGSEAVTLLRAKRRALDRLDVEGVGVSPEVLGGVLWGRRLEAGGVPVDGRGVRRIGAGASATYRTRTDGITAR
jgi:hypothetical protein